MLSHKRSNIDRTRRLIWQDALRGATAPESCSPLFFGSGLLSAYRCFTAGDGIIADGACIRRIASLDARGVMFDDGGQASGTFTTDASSGGLLSFDITTTAGSALPGFHYDSSTTGFVGNNYWNMNSFLVASSSPSSSPYMTFQFIAPLTSGGVNPLVTGHNLDTNNGSWECNNCTPMRLVTGGYATTLAAIPEPETYAMLLAGLGLLGFIARRRKQQEAA